MPWASDYLLMKTNSHFNQYDNLRKDLIQGKFYDATSGTHYAHLCHTGTKSYLISSQNEWYMATKTAKKAVVITSTVTTNKSYFQLHSHTTGTLKYILCSGTAVYCTGTL